jgi:tetratricopeptide (TPR) repeat protein
MASWWSGLLVVVVLGAIAGGCAHGRAAEPTSAAARACAGIAPLSVLAGASETAVARGQALYCLGLYEPALSVLIDQAIRQPVDAAVDDEVASPPAPVSSEAAPLTADRLPALRWLVYVHRRFPGWDRIDVAVGEVARGDLERPELADVRDDLLLLAARFEYQRGAFDEALALLRKIPRSSALRLRALLIEGAIHVRVQAMEPAVAAFAEALRIAPAGDERDLAFVSLARVHYAMAHYEVAGRFYDRVPPSSQYWPRATVEGAWTSFQMKDYPRTLARLQTLAGRLADIPAPTMAEAIAIEATVALYTCRKADFQKAFDRFNATYPTLFVEAKRRIQNPPEALFDVGFSVRTGGTLPPPLDTAVMRQVLAAPPVARRFDEVDELEHERALYDALDAGWRASVLGSAVGNELASRRFAVRREAGEQLQRHLKTMADELGAQIKQTIRIEYESMPSSPVPSDEDPWDACRASQLEAR